MMHASGGAPTCGSVRLTSSVAILFFSSIGSGSGLLIVADSSAFLPVWPAESGLGFFFLGPCGVVDLHAGSIAQRSENLVATSNNFVPFFQTVRYLNIRCSTNTRRNGYENGFLFVLENEHSLQFFLRIALRKGRRLDHGFLGLLLRRQFAPLPDRQGLDRNGERVVPGRRCDSRGCREPRQQVGWRVLNSYDDLKILGFLAARGRLCRRHAGRPKNRVVPDLS